jgi:hypothetical protein
VCCSSRKSHQTQTKLNYVTWLSVLNISVSRRSEQREGKPRNYSGDCDVGCPYCVIIVLSWQPVRNCKMCSFDNRGVHTVRLSCSHDNQSVTVRCALVITTYSSDPIRELFHQKNDYRCVHFGTQLCDALSNAGETNPRHNSSFSRLLR